MKLSKCILALSTTLLLASCGGNSNDPPQTDTKAQVVTSSTTGSVAVEPQIVPPIATPTEDNKPPVSIPPQDRPPVITPPVITPPPVVVPNEIAPFGQNADQYVLTFSDEFDGSSLNQEKWNDHVWYESASSVQNYAVEDGKLKIWPTPEFENRAIDTDFKFYQTYGYFEMEAKLPKGRGVWPAFWLYNHDSDSNFRPEIDIMEAYPGGGPDSGWSDASLNPTTYSATIWPGKQFEQAGFKMVVPGMLLNQDFHKYAVKWEPGKQSYYFDGELVYTVNVDMPGRMYVLLDLWYGSASGRPNLDETPTGKSNAFEINYVRVWQFK